MLYRIDSTLIQVHKKCENKRKRKAIQCTSNQKKADVATLVSDKVDFKAGEKEEHFITRTE